MVLFQAVELHTKVQGGRGVTSFVIFALDWSIFSSSPPRNQTHPQASHVFVEDLRQSYTVLDRRNAHIQAENISLARSQSFVSKMKCKNSAVQLSGEVVKVCLGSVCVPLL